MSANQANESGQITIREDMRSNGTNVFHCIAITICYREESFR